MSAPKSPWNPSKSATKRVLDPLPVPTHCRYCGSEVKIVSHQDVYGKAYSKWPWVYACTDTEDDIDCDARTGMHPFTSIPLGTLARAALREKRMKAKALFEPLWINDPDRRGARTAAYAWLADAMGIPVAECHFGFFNEEQCEKALEVLTLKRG